MRTAEISSIGPLESSTSTTINESPWGLNDAAKAARFGDDPPAYDDNRL